ncbi:unnamed protein product [Peronospora belbahrii]|uniref:Uncharacterized protein n=1 Tax=Peronospora belbahrii TaxID=622444 RepID=A0ABN8CTK9_9STRA|nr:unnamed protein product [Peronospora belbahrii]
MLWDSAGRSCGALKCLASMSIKLFYLNRDGALPVLIFDSGSSLAAGHPLIQKALHQQEWHIYTSCM